MFDKGNFCFMCVKPYLSVHDYVVALKNLFFRKIFSFFRFVSQKRTALNKILSKGSSLLQYNIQIYTGDGIVQIRGQKEIWLYL